MLKRTVSGLVTLIIIIALFLGGAATAYFHPDLFKGIFKSNDKNYEVVEKNTTDDFDLEMPGEVEKRTITIEEVEVKLEELSEFSSYMGSYHVTLEKEEVRYWLEKWKIPGSKNSIKITCDGVIKVGYNIKDIRVQVEDSKIYIALPEPKINDNYVIWDTVECTESNNILNPISFSQYQELIKEIEEKGQEETGEEIYKKAEDNIKILINGFLSEFSDYEIVYM
ncbi:Protein of unknown function [Sarcina sp. DSM 11001]|uniref:DUF4230 domain-containing protein n=1 Tax=Sarcina sp. DSM 11001 TaxID=1798184 RepID=UPI00087EA91D|nr:DUF4230 domain-containing protein [Sarcina sp. DSM 11001]SDM08186.1 Protein of unknown function [Sarcina sp. DSM 11001]